MTGTSMARAGWCAVALLVAAGCEVDPRRVTVPAISSGETRDAGGGSDIGGGGSDRGAGPSDDGAPGGEGELPPDPDGLRLGDGVDTLGVAVDAGGPPLAGVDAGACSPGQTSCASATEVIACGSDGTWSSPVACEIACVGSSCGGECVPGRTECVSTTLVRSCSPAALWSEPTECENACIANACGGECRPGLSRCTSATEVQRCGDDGLWAPSTACENACVGASCAGECSPGSSECFSSRQQRTCGPEGQFLPVETCPNACVGGECGGECVPGSRRCAPASASVAQLCSSVGVWEDDAACPFVCIGSGTCGGECDPGSRRCDPASGLPQECDSTGQWENDGVCAFVCVGQGACGGECDPGSRRCDPVTGVPQECSAAAQWESEPACPFTCGGAGQCQGECANGDARCVGSTLERCVGSQWVEEDDCGSAALCRADIPACVERECFDDTNPNSTVIDHPTFGCGLSWDFPEDPGSAWVEFDSGLHVDTETGIAWKHPTDTGAYTVAELTELCSDFTFAGIGSNWRLPTIDETRALGAGCAPTEPGGECPLADPACLTVACGDCASCLGGAGSTGRAEDGLYCRPNTRLCFGLHTSSLCPDCPGDGRWEYGESNGNMLTRATTIRIGGSFCIHTGVSL